MFDTVKKSSRLDVMMCLVSLLISLLVHMAMLCTIVVLPLIFFDVLHEEELLTFLVPLPSAPVQPPPPAPPRNNMRAVRAAVSSMGMDFAPQRIPDSILPPSDDSPMAIGIDHLLDGMGVPTGTGNGSHGAVDCLVPKDLISTPPLPPPPKRTPIRIGDLQPSTCIFRVDPVYPRLAILARVSGAVILEATIDEEGNVTGIKVLAGHPLLRVAAVEAVKQWKYSPTVLNGEPVPILATVTVIFKLR